MTAASYRNTLGEQAAMSIVPTVRDALKGASERGAKALVRLTAVRCESEWRVVGMRVDLTREADDIACEEPREYGALLCCDSGIVDPLEILPLLCTGGQENQPPTGRRAPLQLAGGIYLVDEAKGARGYWHAAGNEFSRTPVRTYRLVLVGAPDRPDLPNGCVSRTAPWFPGYDEFAATVFGRRWLRPGNSDLGGALVLVDWDERAWFDVFSVEPDHLLVRVAGRQEFSRLHIVGRLELFSRDEERILQVSSGLDEYGSARIQLESNLVAADLLLLDQPTEDVLDKVSENASGPRRLFRRDGLNTSNPDELPQLLREGESEYLEYKSWIADADTDAAAARRRNEKITEVVRTVAAFANHKGGTVLLGVTDAGDLDRAGISSLRAESGPPDLDAYARRIRDAVEQRVHPSTRCSITIHRVNDGGLGAVTLRVPAAPHIIYVAEGPTNVIYVRRGATTRRAYDDEVVELARERPSD